MGGNHLGKLTSVGPYFRYVTLLMVLVLFSGCMLTRDPVRITVRDPSTRNLPFSDIHNGKISPMLKGFWQFALLSAASKSTEITLNNICKIKSKYVSRWVRDAIFDETNIFPITPKFRLKIGGIGYGIWQDRSYQKRKRIALVFRGTDFTSPADWYSNARWITRLNILTWDQYQQTRALVEILVPKLKKKYGSNVEIVAVGHSLGGGLAQHAAYSSPDISLVYAFAPSPVTGSTSIDPKIDPTNVNIFRIYEAGEVLSGLRWVGRRLVSLTEKDPQIREIRFNFRTTYKRGSIGGGLFRQHGINQLACDLVCGLEMGSSMKKCNAIPLP